MASKREQALLQVTRQNFNLRNLDQLSRMNTTQFPVWQLILSHVTHFPKMAVLELWLHLFKI